MVESISPEESMLRNRYQFPLIISYSVFPSLINVDIIGQGYKKYDSYLRHLSPTKT
jgi:hypothetical protein